ncbi:hypothetical protein I3760_14G109400 [Carya illinoinensis]|nr:hypothetical protein I3760_14G109400 [Carya illinoinensis]
MEKPRFLHPDHRPSHCLLFRNLHLLDLLRSPHLPILIFPAISDTFSLLGIDHLVILHEYTDPLLINKGFVFLSLEFRLCIFFRCVDDRLWRFFLVFIDQPFVVLRRVFVMIIRIGFQGHLGVTD